MVSREPKWVLGVSMAVKRRLTYGTAWSRKKRRTSVRRKRRFVRKRRTALTSQSGGITRGGYSGRRLNKRRYTRILKDASLVSQHFRSLLHSGQFITSTPALVSGGTVNAIKMIANSFWTAVGGLTASDVAAPNFSNGDLMIRGGKSTLAITNTSVSSTMRVRTWRARTTAAGGFTQLSPNIPVSAAWDPSHLVTGGGNTDFHRFYRFYDPREVLLEPRDTFERMHFFKGHKVDQGMFNSDQRIDFWIYMVSDVANNTAIDAHVTTQHNLSFTGDNTI